MTYSITEAASNDIDEIWYYTARKWSLEQADRYYNLIYDEIEALALHPFKGADCSHLKKGYRRRKAGSHFIFYLIDKSKDEIVILRVLHQQMNLQDRLSM